MPMVVFMGIIDKLNKFKTDITCYSFYANRASEWSRDRHACTDHWEKFDSNLARAAFRQAPGTVRSAEQLQRLYLSDDQTVIEKFNKAAALLVCSVTQERDRAARRIKLHKDRAASENAKAKVDIFEAAGVSSMLVLKMLETLDPRECGNATPEYVDQMAKLCAYMKLAPPEKTLAFANNVVLKSLWREALDAYGKESYSSMWHKGGEPPTYTSEDLKKLFSTVEEVKGRDYFRFCLVNHVKVDIAAYLSEATVQSLAKVFMLLNGYDTLRIMGKCLLWFCEGSWIAIVSGEHVVGVYWSKFRDAVTLVLKDAVVGYELNPPKLIAKLDSAAFVGRVCNECKPFVASMEATKEVKQEYLPSDVKLFLAECCVLGTGLHERTSELFKAYESFCATRGIAASFVRGNAFAEHINSQGDLFRSGKSDGKRYIAGLKLKVPSS
jgi:hypothetical protein